MREWDIVGSSIDQPIDTFVCCGWGASVIGASEHQTICGICRFLRFRLEWGFKHGSM